MLLSLLLRIRIWHGLLVVEACKEAYRTAESVYNTKNILIRNIESSQSIYWFWKDAAKTVPDNISSLLAKQSPNDYIFVLNELDFYAFMPVQAQQSILLYNLNSTRQILRFVIYIIPILTICFQLVLTFFEKQLLDIQPLYSSIVYIRYYLRLFSFKLKLYYKINFQFFYISLIIF